MTPPLAAISHLTAGRSQIGTSLSRAGPALPLLVIAFAAAGLAPLALARRRYLIARGATVLSAATILWGWFVAQAPRLVGPRLTFRSAAASHASLAAIAIAGGVVRLLVLPAMYLLFTLFARPMPEVVK